MIPLEYLDNIKDGWVKAQFEQFRNVMAGMFGKEHNSDGTHRIATPSGVVPVGMIADFGMASPPTGWVLCDGTPLNRETYKSLFEVIGTNYGPGDGSTTFNVPDSQGRFRLGKAVAGTGSVLGETGGEIDHTHSMGDHTHTIDSVSDHDHSGSTSTNGSHSHSQGAHSHALVTVAQADAAPNSPFGSVAGTVTQTDIFNDSGTGSAGSHNHSISGAGGHDHGGETGVASGGTSGTENPPYIVTTVCIYAGV